MSNIKDTVATICGLVIAISGGIVLAVNTGMVVLAPVIVNYSILAGIVAGSILGFLTGKNPNGTTKTREQIKNQMGHPKV